MHPDILVSRIFRAKYFRDGDLLNAKVRPYNSYAWKCFHRIIEIFKTGLIQDTVQGSWKWKGTSNGEFTVKTAYYLIRDWLEAKCSHGGETSNIEIVSRAWRTLWRIKVPDKIKILTWRIFHNALPVVVNLKRRGCVTEYGCVFCGFKDESVKHLFMECWWTKALWNKLGIKGINNLKFGDAADWLWSYMVKGRVQDLKLIMVGMWIVWYNRNLSVHGKQAMSLDWCWYRILSTVHQFEEKRLWGFHEANDAAPGPDQVVIFCDGSWSAETKEGGFAAVAMHRGVILACRADWTQSCSSVYVAEYRALMEAFALAELGGWRHVSIASDSSETIWAVQTGNWNVEGGPEEVTRSLELLNNHPDWSFRLVPREENTCADTLAKQARRYKWSWKTMTAIPNCVRT